MARIRTTLASILLVFAACKSERLEDVVFDQPESLPGFTIALPTGKRLKSESAPAAGQIIVERAGAIVTVGWQAGKMPKEEMASIAAGMQALVAGGMKTATPEGTDADVPAPSYGSEFILPTDKKVFLATSVIQCADSNVTVTLGTMGAAERERAKAFHDRLTATLKCGDASSAMNTALGLPSFDQGDAIGYLPGSDPPAWFSKSGARWYVTPGVAAVRAAFERPEAVAALLGGLGMEILEQTRLPGEGDWLRVQLKVAVEGETGHVLAGVLTCGESAYTVMHIKGDMTVPDPADLARVKCPTGNVDAANLPTVSQRLGGACEAGDGLACEALAMLVDEEPKLLAAHDAAALRKRACELGQQHMCAGG